MCLWMPLYALSKFQFKSSHRMRIWCVSIENGQIKNIDRLGAIARADALVQFVCACICFCFMYSVLVILHTLKHYFPKMRTRIDGFCCCCCFSFVRQGTLFIFIFLRPTLQTNSLCMNTCTQYTFSLSVYIYTYNTYRRFHTTHFVYVDNVLQTYAYYIRII